MATLAAAQFDVVSDVVLSGAKFDDYQMVLFNNYDLESIQPGRKQDLERYVQGGGGLLVIGHSESLLGIRHDLESVRQSIYRKP